MGLPCRAFGFCQAGVSNEAVPQGVGYTEFYLVPATLQQTGDVYTPR